MASTSQRTVFRTHRPATALVAALRGFSIVRILRKPFTIACLEMTFVLLLSACNQQSPTDATRHRSNPPAEVTIAAETTFVTEPISENGCVNFVAALNQLNDPGITHEQNFVAAFVRVLGSGLESPVHTQELGRRIGVTDIPIQGSQPISRATYASERGMDNTGRFFQQCKTAAARVWTDEEFPEVARWLDQCQMTLGACVDATKLPGYFYPLVVVDTDPAEAVPAVMAAELPLPQKCRDVAQALAARAMRRAGEGDVRGFQRDVMALYRMSRLLSSGSTLIDSLVGSLIQSMANDCLIGLINAGQLDAEQTQSIQKQLTDLSPIADVAQTVCFGEKLSTLDLAMTICDKGPAALRFAADVDVVNWSLEEGNIDWDTALRSSNGWYDRFEAAAQESTFSRRIQATRQLEAALKRATGNEVSTQLMRLGSEAGDDPHETGQRLGHLLTALTLPGSLAAITVATRYEMSFELAQLALQLHQHRLAMGDFPASLTELKSDTPIDRFTGQSLQYRRENRILTVYSIGGNQQDEGGPTDTRGFDDVGFRLSRR